MKHIILTIIILFTLLFSVWCSAQARHPADSLLSEYLLRNWLDMVPVTVCIADPNDPNRILTTHTRVRLNLATWLSNRSPEINAIAQGRPYGIGWSDDRKWRGNAVEVVE